MSQTRNHSVWNPLNHLRLASMHTTEMILVNPTPSRNYTLPLPLVDRMTDACENITFPQLLLRVLTMICFSCLVCQGTISQMEAFASLRKVAVRWDVLERQAQ